MITATANCQFSIVSYGSVKGLRHGELLAAVDARVAAFTTLCSSIHHFVRSLL